VTTILADKTVWEFCYFKVLLIINNSGWEHLSALP
jgi:hypothetical protein